MSDGLRGLSPSGLRDLAAAIESRAAAPPFTPLQLRRLGFEGEYDVSTELQRLSGLGLSPSALAEVMRLVAAERQVTQQVTDRTELVWTGPETGGARSRDTAVVVRELLSSAERVVHVATYAVFQGPQVFEPLVVRMHQIPGLRVRLFVNVGRPHGSQASENQILKAFADAFRRDQWPDDALPEVYYDPRALTKTAGPKASLHAKAIVVDDARSFITSANFTEAGHARNLEAGVLVESATLATSLRLHFDSLVEVGSLKRLPL